MTELPRFDRDDLVGFLLGLGADALGEFGIIHADLQVANSRFLYSAQE